MSDARHPMQLTKEQSEHELEGPIKLKVIDQHGKTLVSTERAKRGDFVVSADLPGGKCVLDLYGHYQHRFAHEPDAPYIAHDALCKTYEKFGQAIQDRLEIIVKIQRSTSTSA